jgi:hypothetical protein
VKAFIVISGLVLAAAFILPPIMENAPTTCAAVAIKVLSLSYDKGMNNPFPRGMMNALSGPVVSEAIRSTYPDVPAVASCTWVYWRVTLDPSAQPIGNLRRQARS